MNSKSKGNTFERDMSRLLSLWWTNGKRDDAIWRSASSGALTTVGKGRYLAHTGDFAATDGDAELLFKHVIIEAKRGYNRYSVQDLLDVPTHRLAQNPVYDMIMKLGITCETQNKYGLLLWKRDRRELLVFSIKQMNGKNLSLLASNNNCTVHLPDWVVHGDTWDNFKVNVFSNYLRSLLRPLVASSLSTPSTPS